MTIMIKTLALGAGFAAIAAAQPVAAQYYGGAYGYNNVHNVAAQRCAAEVQNQLSYRDNRGGILGALLGINNYSNARVLSITRVNPNRNRIRVRGVATIGRLAYNPDGVGAYGMLGSNYALRPDLSVRCEVDYRGFGRDVDIDRR